MGKIGAGGSALLAAMLIVATVPAVSADAPPTSLNQMMSYDGLVQTKVKDIEMAYILPGASLAHYTSFMLDPVYVSFSKDWKPTGAMGFPIAASDLDSIRTRMAKLVYQEFSKELQRKGGFPMVTAPGPDVLRIKLNIINLVVTAPDTMSSGTRRVGRRLGRPCDLVRRILRVPRQARSWPGCSTRRPPRTRPADSAWPTPSPI